MALRGNVGMKNLRIKHMRRHVSARGQVGGGQQERVQYAARQNRKEQQDDNVLCPVPKPSVRRGSHGRLGKIAVELSHCSRFFGAAQIAQKGRQTQ